MRVLLLHHRCPAGSSAGEAVRRTAKALGEGRHDTRIMAVGPSVHILSDVPIQWIDMPNPVASKRRTQPPGFPGEVESGSTFFDMTAGDLAAYRDTLRVALDQTVAEFDPNVIHAQHLWVWGQLALETGVPYVLTAWPTELDQLRRQARFCDLAEQAVENASAILVNDAALAAQVAAAFPNLDTRAITQTDAEDELLRVYETALVERFGQRA